MSGGVMRVTMAAHSLLLPDDQVRASVPRPGLTPIPGSPIWLIGAWNYHGQAVAVIDFAALSGLSPTTLDAGWIVLVEGARGLVGLLATGPAAETTLPRKPVATPLDTSSGTDMWVDLDRLFDAMDGDLRLPG